MTFPLNPVLMELLVLALISQNDSYGYEISQRLRQVSSRSSSRESSRRSSSSAARARRISGRVFKLVIPFG